MKKMIGALFAIAMILGMVAVSPALAQPPVDEVATAFEEIVDLLGTALPAEEAVLGIIAAIIWLIAHFGLFILVAIAEVGIPFLRIIDEFIHTIEVLMDFWPFISAVLYTIAALFGAIFGIFIIPLILAFIAMAIIFILDLLWNFGYHSLDTMRSFIDFLIDGLAAVKENAPPLEPRFPPKAQVSLGGE
jgi:hypothetical protein